MRTPRCALRIRSTRPGGGGGDTWCNSYRERFVVCGVRPFATHCEARHVGVVADLH